MFVDLLYGELEGEEETAALESVEKDPEAVSELEALRGVRAMMAELPDEEPPPAISAQLLHAAAKQAKPAARSASAQAAGGVGFVAWLKRFFQPLAMHPAMAAAATFVLVAGVAGALYVSGEVSVSEPRAPAPASASEEGVAAKAEAASADPAAAESPMEVDVPTSRFDHDVVLDEKAVGNMPAGQAAVGEEDYRAGRLGGKPEGSKASNKRPRPAAKRRAKADRAGPGFSDSFGVGGGSVGAQNRPPADPAPVTTKAKGTKKKAPAKTAGPVLQGTSGDSLLVDGDAPELESSEQESTRDERVNQARAWHQKAVKAAGEGECDAVIEIGQRVRKLDSRYYDTVYLRDKRLVPCRRGTAPNSKK